MKVIKLKKYDIKMKNLKKRIISEKKNLMLMIIWSLAPDVIASKFKPYSNYSGFKKQ